LYHGKARSQSADGIGHRNPAIVMGVNTEIRFHGICRKGLVLFNSFKQLLNYFLDLKRQGTAIRITENDDIRTGLYGG